MVRRTLITALAIALLMVGCATETEPTTTVPAPLATLVLTPDGLGDVLFGLDPDTVIDSISDLFGGPDLDSEWIPAEPNEYGSCPGDSMRAIGWGSLVMVFIDEAESDLGGYLYSYTYGYDYGENMGGIDPRGLGLTTAAGIGIGSTLAELRSAYGSDVVVEGDTALDVWSFAAETTGFRGLLSGGSDTDTVTLIEPLEGCS